jgi:peptidoglycan hydrolase-like protein with peptidoglycan-binding domain
MRSVGCKLRLIDLTAGALLFAIACGHTHSVGDTTSNTTGNTTGNTTPPADQRAAPPKHSGRVSADKGGLVDGPGRDGAVPLATSPTGLLKPHAIEKIQEKLASSGRLSEDHETGKMDEPTRKALREFQQSKNLPATGMPDDVTIQKLGLGTEDVFRASEDPAKDAQRAK